MRYQELVRRLRSVRREPSRLAHRGFGVRTRGQRMDTLQRFPLVWCPTTQAETLTAESSRLGSRIAGLKKGHGFRGQGQRQEQAQ